jgi:peptide/nickel transport system permease protein
MVLLARKILRLLLILLAVTAVTFVLINLLPGDAAFVIGGENATSEDIAAIREELALDENIAWRYIGWLGDLVRGDFGVSFLTREPVLQTIAARLPVTIELILIAQLIALALALPAGIYSAYRNQTFIDGWISGFGFAFLSVPSFVMGLLLIYLFALRLKWFPATGYLPFSAGSWANLQSIVLPSLSIALIEWVPLMRVLRTDMITTLREDYIKVARAKGMPTWRILFRDALKPSALTLITVVGLQIGHWIGAAVIIEMIFALPGIGRLLVDAVFSRDFFVAQGCVVVITVAYVVINGIVDGLYSLLDPRLRRESPNV